MKKDIRSKVIVAIAKAYEQNDTATVERIEAILIPNEHELPKELQECLESWGITPIEEPEFFAGLEGATLEDIKAMAIKDLDIDAFDALDVATFASRVHNQIISKIAKDGKYKTTPNIDKVKLPKTSQLRKLKEMSKGEDAKDDKARNDAVKKEMFTIIGVDESSLSKWESNLVQEMIFAYIKAVDNDTIGKFSDRTPFARYIKNV